MINASRGRVRTTAFVSGMTRLTNCSAVLRTWGMAIVISPSAVCIGFGRVPLREPVAAKVRSYRARPRKAVTSSSTARCNTSRAPNRPSSANFSLLAASSSPSNSSICASSRALGAILSIWRSSPLGGLSDLPLGDYASFIFSHVRDAICTDCEYLVACKGAEPTANRQRAHGVLTGGACDGCPRRDVPRTVGCARFPHALEDDFADCGSCALDEPECATGLVDRSEQGVERLMSLPTDGRLEVNVGQRDQCVPLTQRQFDREWTAGRARSGNPC